MDAIKKIVVALYIVADVAALIVMFVRSFLFFKDNGFDLDGLIDAPFREWSSSWTFIVPLLLVSISYILILLIGFLRANIILRIFSALSLLGFLGALGYQHFYNTDATIVLVCCFLANLLCSILSGETHSGAVMCALSAVWCSMTLYIVFIVVVFTIIKYVIILFGRSGGSVTEAVPLYDSVGKYVGDFFVRK